MVQNLHLDLVSQFYDTHPINEQQILDKLAHDDADIAHLSEDILQNYDQDHYGGVAANDALAQLAGLDKTCHVLDVCAGMGGPARYLAHNYGCRVTGIDLTESRVAGAVTLTRMVGLDDRVTFRCANALDMPFADRTFDVVISQEAFCHIPNKPQLIAQCVRVLTTGGRMAFTDILKRDCMSAAAQERLHRELTMAELESFDGYRQLFEREGCSILEAQDVGTEWQAILVERLAMYRSLKDQTVARFGEAHFKKWDDAYAFFVDLYDTGELGGGRFIARLDG